jgi:hypothetical protein
MVSYKTVSHTAISYLNVKLLHEESTYEWLQDQERITWYATTNMLKKKIA